MGAQAQNIRVCRRKLILLLPFGAAAATIPLRVSAASVPWCNGSTRDFDSLCLGSNPGGTRRRHLHPKEPCGSPAGLFLRRSTALSASRERLAFAAPETLCLCGAGNALSLRRRKGFDGGVRETVEGPRDGETPRRRDGETEKRRDKETEKRRRAELLRRFGKKTNRERACAEPAPRKTCRESGESQIQRFGIILERIAEIIVAGGIIHVQIEIIRDEIIL